MNLAAKDLPPSSFLPSSADCRLCVSLVGPTLHDLSSQIDQAVNACDMIEVRLDKLHFSKINELLPLIETLNIPIIWTLRKKLHDDLHAVSETDKLYCQLLRELVTVIKPCLVDLEGDISTAFLQELKSLSPKTQWIISWHDYHSTPNDLDQIFEKILSLPADFYKIATQANTINDALRMIKLSKHAQARNIPFCGLCMGKLGQCTRILGPVIGHPWTYASLKKGLESADGQIPFQELIQTYRFREISPRTAVYGLIGHPIDKSLSHLTHNAVLKELAIDAIYVKFDVKEEDLLEFMRNVRCINIKGLSVTMPLKSLVSAWTVKKVGLQVYNTLLFNTDCIEGFNTDGLGALKTLGFLSLKGKKIVIIGAGGVASAIAHAASNNGAIVTLCNRTKSKAEVLAAQLNCAYGDLSHLNQLVKEGYDILVQATSVGMAPLEALLPISAEAIFPGSHVLEVISNPSETALIREARRRGCHIYLGSDLFLHQAVQQFVCWFGLKVNPTVVEEIIRKNLPQYKKVKHALIHKSCLAGVLKLPPSKSHSIRAILLGTMAKGESTISSLLDSPDISQTIAAARCLGAEIVGDCQLLTIKGLNGVPQNRSETIDAGNSGQILRFAAAFASLGSSYTVITGDESIRTNRPIQPLMDGLNGLGAASYSKGENGYAPLAVKGPIKAGSISIDGADSQPVSALIMAAAFLEGTTQIDVVNAGEKPWLALTLSWLDRLGVEYTHENLEKFTIIGQRLRPGFNFKVPGDFSSAAFPIVATLMTHSTLIIENADMQDVQGDKALITLLQKMGADIVVDSQNHRLHVKGGKDLLGCVIDVNAMIDSVPILAVLGCFALGETRLVNGSIARQKECNRLKCITQELKKMGASIEETEDGLLVKHSHLKGAVLQSHHDHRMALSLIVAGLSAEGATKIEGIDCITKSYPGFIDDLKTLGGHIYVES